MTTESVMVGKGERGWIVCASAPGMSKMIVSRPGWALASRIACRSDPSPPSAVLITAYTDRRRRSASASRVNLVRAAGRRDQPRLGEPAFERDMTNSLAGRTRGNEYPPERLRGIDRDGDGGDYIPDT